MSRGIVSAIRPTTDLAEFGVKGRKTDRFVQVDAAISQGCSGGPIIDSNGTVVAISTFILTRGQALNFGVPSAYVCELLDLAEACKPLRQYCQTTATSPIRSSDRNSGAGSIAAAGTDRTDQATEREAIDHFIRLYAVVIYVDGEVSENEMTIMFRVSEEWGFSRSQVGKAIANYNCDSKIYSSTQLAGRAAAYLKCSLNSDQKNSILMDLIRISEADGMSEEEAEIITAIQKIWD